MRTEPRRPARRRRRPTRVALAPTALLAHYARLSARGRRVVSDMLRWFVRREADVRPRRRRSRPRATVK